eukprot:361491-Chlamydomonas_euryale.AAC.9
MHLSELLVSEGQCAGNGQGAPGSSGWPASRHSLPAVVALAGGVAQHLKRRLLVLVQEHAQLSQADAEVILVERVRNVPPTWGEGKRQGGARAGHGPNLGQDQTRACNHKAKEGLEKADRHDCPHSQRDRRRRSPRLHHGGTLASAVAGRAAPPASPEIGARSSRRSGTMAMATQPTDVRIVLAAQTKSNTAVHTSHTTWHTPSHMLWPTLLHTELQPKAVSHTRVHVP